LAEWIVDAGIGETRAALVDQGRIVAARLVPDTGLRAGAIVGARLAGRAGARGELALDAGGAALLQPVPPGLSEGARLAVEIVRESIPEQGRWKLPVARRSEEAPRPAPSLADELAPVRQLGPHDADLLEEAGWSELIDQAATGLVPFPGGLLRIDLTAAMTVIDVDGELPPAELARAGAAAAGAAIQRLDIGGSIGIDLPTVPDRAARIAAAEALDAALAPPFERTAVNGFGFLQIVRRRVRPSLPEQVRGDPVRAAALALLRRIGREPARGAATLVAAPAVVTLLESKPDWMAQLARRRGGALGLRSRPDLPISAGHVEA
jgi:hypothetical protein